MSFCLCTHVHLECEWVDCEQWLLLHLPNTPAVKLEITFSQQSHDWFEVSCPLFVIFAKITWITCLCITVWKEWFSVWSLIKTFYQGWDEIQRNWKFLATTLGIHVIHVLYYVGLMYIYIAYLIIHRLVANHSITQSNKTWDKLVSFQNNKTCNLYLIEQYYFVKHQI